MNSTTALRKVALMAGTGYLAIFFTGIFANFFVLEKLVVRDDANLTLNNITTNAGEFRLGILAFIIMVLFDLVLTWALYVLLQQVGKKMALFMAWFRLVNCAIFAVALFQLFDVLELTGGHAYLEAMPTEYIRAEVMRALSAFNYTWLLGLLFFGVHLLALGLLVLRARYIPKFIGVLLLLAGVGYLTDSFAQFLLTNYAAYQDMFMLVVVVPGVVGELSFTVWLLLRGGRQQPDVA